MNIKNLRKNYDRLSKRERLILYDAAENRDDKAEMNAILLATPNRNWIKPDFAPQAEKLLALRLVSFAQQLKHSRNALFWLTVSYAEDDAGRIFNSEDFAFESARLSAYLYCVSVKTHQTVFEELGLDCEVWDNKRAEIFNLNITDDLIDGLMRSISFDEEEAEGFINKTADEHGIENVFLRFTVKNEVKGLREILKKRGFKNFFDD
jgi:hypothetical protein